MRAMPDHAERPSPDIRIGDAVRLIERADVHVLPNTEGVVFDAYPKSGYVDVMFLDRSGWLPQIVRADALQVVCRGSALLYMDVKGGER